MKANAFSSLSSFRALFLGCFVALFATQAQARAKASGSEVLSNLKEEVTFLEGAMHRLEEEYQEIPDATKPAKVRQYLRLAKEAFQIKDYEKCSLAIYSIINSEKLRKTGKRAIALHFLAESVYQLQNFTTRCTTSKKCSKKRIPPICIMPLRNIEIGSKGNKMDKVADF